MHFATTIMEKFVNGRRKLKLLYYQALIQEEKSGTSKSKLHFSCLIFQYFNVCTISSKKVNIC